VFDFISVFEIGFEIRFLQLVLVLVLTYAFFFFLLSKQWRRNPHTAARRGWLGQEPEVSEHVARAKAPHPEVRGSGDGSLILPHGGDGWGKNPRCASESNS
jgi:hypothetical protein